MAESDDRRAAERIPVIAGTACTFAGRVVDDVGAVRIRDVSLQGIGIVLMRSVPIGTVLVITLSHPGRLSRTMAAGRTLPVPGGFLVGGSFKEPLTYQELTALVM